MLATADAAQTSTTQLDAEFGELLFSRNKSAHFLKVSHTAAYDDKFANEIITPQSQSGREHFLGEWKLKRPELVLWISGQTTGACVPISSLTPDPSR